MICFQYEGLTLKPETSVLSSLVGMCRLVSMQSLLYDVGYHHKNDTQFSRQIKGCAVNCERIQV